MSGDWIKARGEAAKRGEPIGADDTRRAIARFERGRTSRAAMAAIGRAAIDRGNLTDEARQVWRDYLARLA